MTEFTEQGFEFRIKKMNALELLALQSQINFDSMSQAMKTYNTMLEYVEVKVKDQWIQVKQGDNYYPATLVDDLTLMQNILKHMIEYVKSLFHSSNESK